MQRILPKAFPSSSSNTTDATHYVIDRRPPPDLGKWKNCKRFMWNKEKRLLCNRSCGSWAKLFCCYFISVTIMLGIFFGMMFGFTTYIRCRYKLPWIDKKSLIKYDSPGVEFIPNIIRLKSPLLWYTFEGNHSRDNIHYDQYVKFIDKYMKQYDDAEKNKHLYSNCATSKETDRPCIILREDFGPCGKEGYGYPEKKPCIYMPEWIPQYYKGDDLPGSMPDSLKQAIRSDVNKKKLWIHCGGLFPVDDDHIGKITYYPEQGINGLYYPYDGHSHYLQPLVAVQIENIENGIITNIQCSAWAKNIKTSDPKTHTTYIQLYLAEDN